MMDDTDGTRTVESPFGDDLTPAVRRVDSTPEPAIRRIEPESESSPPDIDIEELTGDPQTLEPAIQGIWIIQSSISAAILGIIAGVAFSILGIGGPWVGGAVFTVGVVLGSALSILRYRIWTYQVRTDSLYLRRGVFTRVNTVAPYVRIQHVDTRRSPLERIFGLATTVVYTAGSRGADVSIPGLTPERADDLQTRLKQLAIAAEGEDAV